MNLIISKISKTKAMCNNQNLKFSPVVAENNAININIYVIPDSFEFDFLSLLSTSNRTSKTSLETLI